MCVEGLRASVSLIRMNMTVTTISEFRANAKHYVDNIINDNGTLIINRGNTAAVCVIRTMVGQ